MTDTTNAITYPALRTALLKCGIDVADSLSGADTVIDEADLEAIADAAANDRRVAQLVERYGAPGPEPELELGHVLDTEQFRVMQARVAPMTPEQDGVEVPHVILLLEGVPMVPTITGHRTYVTAFNGQIAEGIGRALVGDAKTVQRAEAELAKALETDERVRAARAPDSAPPLVLATPADMARAAKNASLQQDLRGRG